jgi:hypothetical protein
MIKTLIIKVPMSKFEAKVKKSSMDSAEIIREGEIRFKIEGLIHRGKKPE